MTDHHDPTADPINPQTSFTPCPTCGALVLTRVWVSATKDAPGYWRPLPEPVTPALGVPHRCAEEEPC